MHPHIEKKKLLKKLEPKNLLKKPSGVFSKQISIRNVREDDLKNIKSCEALYLDAVRNGVGDSSEMGAINFLAATCRARDIATKEKRPEDAPRLLMGILKGRRWHHINQSQEERARNAIAKWREQDPYFFCYCRPTGEIGKSRGTFSLDTLIKKCSTALTA